MQLVPEKDWSKLLDLFQKIPQGNIESLSYNQSSVSLKRLALNFTAMHCR